MRCAGKWPSIVMALGLLDAKAIAGSDVPCPICGGRDRFRFSDKGFGRWYCRGCCKGGDGVKLVMAVTGVDEFAEAAKLIEGVVGKTGVYNAKGVGDGRGGGGADTPRDPLRSWREAHPDVLDTVAHTYLKGREIQLTVAEAAALRFHRSLWHWPTKSKWPAMVALVKRADGVELTAHQTFLAPDGSSKASVDRPRLFPKGGLAAGGGVWFGEVDPAREFIITEGIESTLSAMRLYGSLSGCATLSASGIRF
jgi:putative DNA primase/helicase